MQSRQLVACLTPIASTIFVCCLWVCLLVCLLICSTPLALLARICDVGAARGWLGRHCGRGTFPPSRRTHSPALRRCMRAAAAAARARGQVAWGRMDMAARARTRLGPPRSVTISGQCRHIGPGKTKAPRALRRARRMTRCPMRGALHAAPRRDAQRARRPSRRRFLTWARLRPRPRGALTCSRAGVVARRLSPRTSGARR